MNQPVGTDTAYAPGGGGRRAAARKRRRQRRRALVAGLVALALLAAAGAAYLLNSRGPEAVEIAPPQGRTQQTLLLQVRTPEGTAALASALVAVDPSTPTAAVVLVPPQVIVDVPGAGSLPFGQALATGPPNAPSDALADLLGVTIDGSWVLEHGALGALVNAVGGITASVDVPVVRDGAVVLAAGEQVLDGERALLLLGYLGPGEQEQSRLARVQEVLDGLLAALPDDPAAVSALISELGTASLSSEPSARLASLLGTMVDAGEAEALQYDSLPVVVIDPGGGVTAFRLDAEAARALVDRLLAQSVPAGARETGNRVLVLNGVGTSIADAARARLVAADLVFVGARNNTSFGVETPTVLVPEATPEGQALGERVAAALGVPAVVRQSNLGTVADAIVVVGADFQP